MGNIFGGLGSLMQRSWEGFKGGGTVWGNTLCGWAYSIRRELMTGRAMKRRGMQSGDV